MYTSSMLYIYTASILKNLTVLTFKLLHYVIFHFTFWYQVVLELLPQKYENAMTTFLKLPSSY